MAVDFLPENVKLPVGQRVYSEKKMEHEGMKPHRRLVAMSTLFVYTAWPYILMFLLIFSWWRPVLILNLALYSTVLFPTKVFWPEFLNMSMFNTWREYFSFSYKFEEELDAGSRYIIAEFPHGTYPVGPLLAGTLIPRMFPGRCVLSVGASVLFRIPLYKQMFSWMGCQPADRKTFQSLLEKADVAAVVGGVGEMFMQYEEKEQVLLGSRKGFIKMALANGADLLPVYHFGNSRVLSIGPRSLMNFCRRLRISVGILVGRWGLPLPREVPIYMVVGRPVKVEKVGWDSPNFQEKVNELHEKFKKELQRLYEDNKADFGWAKRPLVIA
ncbi:unnamed protein product [Ostreobium quekettii]|uniref:Acyltransferase n=1 Tax=Ostreobium quekettii TaxID=121088 RepID=A0A8S1IK43_9CHLO|nr:unnamed protein product [Ostreobium quekettii]|eukprot:evm.model.scf_1.25 EVM.evm.TU.scf_1.25   scf_1:405302-407753(-)